ncbi:maleylpyruvate isomerase family mycothiol-dependent enzyme [Ilumatobacter sp.]|uniref:maleylpyruvate isomerase family mycothiol-dependent enzyme n=1 Tax=Ilumatobacter sp. TaxID=1967498 RepID=UPI003AF88557
MSLPYHATEHVFRDGQQLIDAARRAGLDAPVESCPGWNMRDLAWHIGQVWTFWGRIVGEQLTDVEQVRATPEVAQPSDSVLLDWVAAAHNGIFSVLNSARADAEVWTWTGSNQDVMWVRRRMAQETAVHRWDAERTVGDAYEIPIAVAADGIDEFLQFFAPRRRTTSIGGTAHIHCTDTDRDVETGSDDIDAVNGEWMIHRLDEHGIEFDREHQKGDVAIRGRARDVLLWLWGRDAGPVELLGDADVARRIVSGASL